MKIFSFVSGMILFTCVALKAGSYTVVSPDSLIKVHVNIDGRLSWSIVKDDKVIMDKSLLALDINELKINPGINPKVLKVSRRHVDELLIVDVPTKFNPLRDYYNELTLNMAGNYSVQFRAYNNGAAYRFVLNHKGKLTVNDETVEFNMPQGTEVWWPMDNFHDFVTPQEVSFEKRLLTSLDSNMKGFLPIHTITPDDIRVVFTEADVEYYTNLFLTADSCNLLRGEYPHVIKESRLKDGSDRTEEILELNPYIAVIDGRRSLPWRIAMISDNDAGLLENALAWQLSSPSVIRDASWIKPGKISWDWWSMLNVYGVDFESGVNTPTYKYIIDFAAEHGLEYILLDEGWSRDTWDIKNFKPEVDVPELVRYGSEKGVGIVLWALWNPLDLDIEDILDVYEGWGVKGIKIDFMNRSDQYMVNFYERVAKAAADRHLLVDFHGAYKPCGIQRKYPNVMTFEGVLGMEHDKDSRDINPVHNLILPFTRMLAGPMDYTPGAVNNATQEDFAINFNHPMSLGTRAQQAALFVVYESPLQMVADSPSNFKLAEEYAAFLSMIPTVWDETIGIDARVGEHLIMARRNREKWYIAALTDWTPRDMQVNLYFLHDGKWKMTTFADGMNAHKQATDYRISNSIVSNKDSVSMHLAPGGGWVAILEPIK